MRSTVERALVLAGLEAVDAVVVFEDDTPLNLVRALEPDVIVKGGDYSPDTIVGAQDVTARGGRVVAVGTTVVRALESSLQSGEVAPFAGETQIFIFPGYRITSVDALVTNFHLPESTLLMLVSAFAGREFMLGAYRHAVEQRYRFFSYGDAMLIWPKRVDS